MEFDKKERKGRGREKDKSAAACSRKSFAKLSPDSFDGS